MINFDKFHNQIKYSGKIILDSGLHIGGSQQEFYGTANTVVKTYDNKPFIPGSSMKGILRTYLERLGQANILDKGDYHDPCVFGDKLCLSEYKNKDARKALLKKCNHDEEKFYETLAKKSCPICHLFGNQLRAGKVRIFDSYVDSNWINQYEIRMGVGISRDTGRTINSALYDFEVVPAGTAFHMEIIADNLTQLEERWLLIALMSMIQGRLSLGGKTARGLGSFRGENWQVEKSNKDNLIENLLMNTGSSSIDFNTYVSEFFNLEAGDNHVENID